MTTYRLLTATAAAALIAGLAASGAAAQTPAAAATAKTEAAAQAATGKASSDAAAATQPQGTAAAVKEGAAPVAAAQGAAPAAGAAKPVAVAGDLVDTLKASGQFSTFIQAVDSTNLTSLLKTNKNLTVFAPTDAAFAALPASELARLKADKAAMQKFVLHHIVNAPIPSSKIKGAKGPVATGAGDQVLLDGSDEAALKADGATIVQTDLQTGSGLLQVVDRVLIAGQGDTSTAAASTGASTGASATAATPPDKQ